MFKVEALKAVHVSGTKFYHVLRVYHPSSACSFSLRHYGRVQLFTELGSMAMGTVEMDEGFRTDTSAGTEKWKKKVKDGYTEGKVSTTWDLDSIEALRSHLKSKVSSALQAELRTALKSMEERINTTVPAPAPKSAPKPVPVIEELDHVKHQDWGSW